MGARNVGMTVGAQDATNLIYKSQMVGVSQNLRTDQKVKETDKQRETEQARTENPESSDTSGSLSVNSNSGSARTAPRRRLGTEDQALHRLGRGQVDWSEQGEQKGGRWLPPSLQPHSKGAGSTSQWNIPYWLMSKDAPQDDSPQAQHKKLINALRSMVNTEIQQYTKQNEPLYAKKTLRDIYSVLGEEGPSSGAPPKATLTGEPSGYTATNRRRAENAFNMLENPAPEPGEAFEMVA